MSNYNIKWLLKPLPIANAPYDATIDVEKQEDGVWTSIYTTNKYQSSYYDVPVPSPEGNYRVKVDLTFYGRRTVAYSNVLNYENDTFNKESIQLPLDGINSVIGTTYGYTPLTVVRSNPQKIQYDAGGDLVTTNFAGLLAPNMFVKIDYNFTIYSVSSTIQTLNWPSINRSQSTKITRLNGSSIGN